ncbi:MAG: hypothetical protein NTV34_18515 [Proteobacteria bacterium]|nr:hypothetical protein [Pseudomonadota bacterium]
MRFIIKAATSIAIVSLSCSTTSKNPAKNSLPGPEIELLCQTPVEGNHTMHLHMQTLYKKGAEVEQIADTVIEWTIKTSKGISIEADRTIIENRNLVGHMGEDFRLGKRDLRIKQDSIPILVSSQGQGQCTQIFVSSPLSEKFPQCNAVGTPSQGWYLGGRVLSHNKTCNAETISCGISTREGWHIQKKFNRVLLAKERCLWSKARPQCVGKNNIVGWYLDNRLIARDDECIGKSIECTKIKEGEGWFSFKRSSPLFFAEAKCFDSVGRSASIPESSTRH